MTDKERFREIWTESAGRLLRRALKLTIGDRALAEDLVQDTAIKLMLQLTENLRLPENARIPRRGEEHQWLFTVLRNKYLDHLRKLKHRPPDWLDPAPPLSFGPADELKKIFPKFTDAELSIVRLGLEDYTLEEIAELVDTTVYEVRKAKSKAEPLLSKYLGVRAKRDR